MERVLYKGSDGGGVDPLDWSGSQPQPLASQKVPIVRFAIEGVGATAPQRSGDFVRGVWTGGVSVFDAGPAVQLNASDGYGLGGRSNTFEVQPGTLGPTRVEPFWVLFE